MMKQKEFERIMEHIIASIEDAGQSPHNQIMAYIIKGDASYITRNGNARGWIQELDQQQIKKYLRTLI